MGFDNRKRDDHGHVIGNDETDGQECKHTTGGDSVKGETQKDGKSFKTQGEKRPLNDAGEVVDESLDFDADYEEEFEDKPSEEDERQYVDKVMSDIADASDKKAFEYVSDNIDELTEAGLISDETSDRLYNALDKKIDEVNNDINKDLMDAINMADDDILDEQFGKDTPERKLAGAMKEPEKDILSDVPGYNETKEKLLNAFSQYQKGKDLEITDFSDDSGYIRFYVNGGIPPSEMVKTLKSLGIKKPTIFFDSEIGKWTVDSNINKWNRG